MRRRDRIILDGGLIALVAIFALRLTGYLG